MRTSCLWLICIVLLSCIAMAQPVGVITGTILDENGQPLDNAQVCLMMRSGKNTAITCGLARTDQIGKFEIKNLENGEYGVFAAKDEEGYSINNQSPNEKVVLTTKKLTAGVTVRLRPRGGVLLGSVTDTVTGQPVKSAWIDYQDIDGKASGSSIISDGRIRLTVPTECDLVVIVAAKGYKGWVFTDPASPTHPVLRLGSGERKILDIQMEPVPENH